MNIFAKAALAAVLVSSTAQANVVIIANPAGPDMLSKAQVSKLYLGKTKKLPNGMKAQIIEQSQGSALRAEFHEAITGKTDAQLQSYWSRLVFTGKGKPPKTIASSDLIRSQVASHPTAIGYIDEADLTSSVKVVYRP